MPGPAAPLAVALVLCACVLAGCGEGNPYSLPDYDGASPAPAPASGRGSGPSSGPATEDADRPRAGRVYREPTPPPQVRYRPADARGTGAWVERGRVVARSPSQRAAVTAVERYLTVRVRLANTWQVDEAALAEVAAGQAVTSARQRAGLQRDQELRTIGRFVLNVAAVRVQGSRASVTGCHFDATSEVDEDGDTVVPPPGGVRITMDVRRTGETWRVVRWPSGPVPTCDWRR